MRRYVFFSAFMLMVFLPFVPVTQAYAQSVSPEEALNRQFRQLSDDTATVSRLIVASLKQHNNADSAIVLLRKALSISNSIGYNDGSAWSLLGIGTNYFNKGELEKSKQAFREAYPYCQRALFSKRSLMLSWYNNMASPYAAQGIYDTAAYFYYKALNGIDVANKKDAQYYSLILDNLSDVWLKANQFQQSLYYSRKGLAFAIAHHDSDRIATVSQNMGLALVNLGDSAAALTALRTSYIIDLKRNNYLGAEMDCCALATMTTNPDSAINYYYMALAFSKRTTMKPLHKIYICLGSTYAQMKRYDSARIYLNIGLQRAKELNFKDDLAYVYSGLADVYTAEHKFELANKYRKAYSDMRDSLVNDEKIRSTNTLEVKYRTADKDRKIAETQLQLLKRDNKLKQKNELIIFVLCIIVVLVIIVISVYRSMRRKERFEKQELLNLQQQQQIGQLKSVMAGEEKERTRIARELHDGIMIQLAVVKMKIRKMRASQHTDSGQNLDEVLQQLDNTSRELRQTAHNLMPDMLLETGLTDALFYYCNNLQKEVPFTIIFQHYGSLPRLSGEAELYLYRIVQELLQNIIKHAHASKALVQMNYHPPFLSFSIEDNGIGFDKQVMDAGMGLKSIDSRLRVLNGTIDIKSDKYRGTTIFIELNVETLIKT